MATDSQSQPGPLLGRRALVGLAGAAGLAVAAAAPAAAASPPAAAPPAADRRRSRVLRPGTPAEAGFDADALEDVFARLARRAADGRFPGAVALVARHGVVAALRATGVKVAGGTEPVGTDTLFDLESMTKVMATSTSAQILVEQGRLRLTDPVARYLPGFAANGKAHISVRDLLRYSSGLPVDNQRTDGGADAIWAFMEATALDYPPGTSVQYSDLGYRLLGRVVEAAAGTDLQTFARTHIWKPLGLKDTLYNPPASLRPRIAATGGGSLDLRPGPLRGSVQDDQDWVLGGIVGCDGLFSTAHDVAVFAQAILNGGSYGRARILSRRSVAAAVRDQTPQVTAAATDQDPTTNLISTPKGYGYELWTPRFSPGGMSLSAGSYGKTGGAGTFVWTDPRRDLVGVLLTNHGLPVPFDQPGWNRLIDDVAPGEFYDGVVRALVRG